MAALFGLHGALALPAQAEVVVLSPEGDATLDRVLKGLRLELATKAQKVRYLSLAREDVASPLRAAESATIFVGLGQRATEEILKQRGAPALVGCLVQTPDALPRSETTAVLPAEIAPDAQAAWLRRLYPRARRVGLLYDPERSDRQVLRLADALRRAGLQAVSTPVRSPTALPAALAGLENKVDVLLGLHDRTVFTPHTAKAILLYSFRSRIPVIGLSESWVKAGALYALEPDYEDLGRQCGRAALRLHGEPQDLPAQPSRLVLSVNLRTARHMRIDWPNEVLHMAHKTHE